MTHLIVGGAGIGGLTAALALAQVGVTVTLFERRPALAEIGAGLQLSPNATRILQRLGLLSAVRSVAMEPRTLRIRRGRDGAVLASLPLGKAADHRYGAPFLVIHRADLQMVLAQRLSINPLARIALGARVTRTDHEGRGVSVSVETEAGATTTAGDGFVDASGLHALNQESGILRDSRRVAWRALVPASALPGSFAEAETNLWLGHRAHLVHYPLRGGSVINVVAITEDDGIRPRIHADFWSEPGDPDYLARSFRGWNRDTVSLLHAAPDWQRWPLADRAPIKPWSVGATTLLGDAAHPMLPFLAQGASQAIEDAEALANAVHASGTVNDGFEHYELRRRARATKVQHVSRRQGEIYHLRRPASDARDLVMELLGGGRALARMDWLYAVPSSADPLPDSKGRPADGSR